MLRIIVWAVVLIIVFIILFCFRPKNKTPIMVILVGSVAILIFMGLWILDENKFGYKEKRQEWEIRREPLYYTYVENGIDGTLAGSIAEFNSDLAKEKAKHDSLWSNWFVGDYIDKIDYIHMPKTNTLTK